ncbi:MAG: valine--tRNA ligase [Myxococcales bacterium]|nr:valine--tRNA ligase [Polyangiaceae bacterium]MDW8251572.1 valine--tRNA ligase [Myxococcales bacterium]
MTDLVHEMPKAFEPQEVEARWYAFWQEHDLFVASIDPEDTRPVYVIQMPPPNVTGSLHMGHAMRVAFEDTLIRWHRMRGFNTLWQPGIDHAGIATQTVVERQLAREGKSRHELGREAFLERVWAWKRQSGGQIALQQRELGASPDWKRSVFTMDPGYARAVKEAFVRLYEEELIYRATRLVNWDVEARTVLSDLEVENEEGANGELFEFAYKVADGKGEIVVATTRPETMLGDTAVAVHPDDERYQHLIGKKLKHPFVDRLVPIIADPILVDRKFGTGAVKVTPAHDFNDFATGKRHGLAEISILTLDGKINEEGGPFAGLDRFEARRAVKKKLAELGLARGSKPHTLTLPRSQRNGSVVEPMISTQWFVRMKPLAEKALAAVAEGRTKILPPEWTKTYNHFLENIQDWCISRQLWWGHRIPAFHCDACGAIHVTRDEVVSSCVKCGSGEVRQDDDVLDTWFSSGLWPFATLGWPDQTPELARFYPGSDLETGYDILFFWVARMMMMGLHFMGDVPFRRVLLAGLLVDETGKKMSKTLGNVIDPLDLIHGATFEQVVQKASPGVPIKEALEKFAKSYPSTAKMGAGFPAFGTDALRMTLASYSPSSTRIALAPRRIEGYRHFCNKLWNATRFALPYLEGVAPRDEVPSATLLANRWILDRLSVAAQKAHEFLDSYRLDETLQVLYHFFWDELCDWFLELTKPVLSGLESPDRHETQAVLLHVLDHAFRLLHPFAPFVTEDLWQRLPKASNAPKSICIARYTVEQDGRPDPLAHREMSVLQAAISTARTLRSEHEVSPKALVPLRLRAGEVWLRELLTRESVAIQTLVRTEGTPVIEAPGGERPRGYVLDVAEDVEVLVGLVGHVDPVKEKDRIERSLKKIEKELENLQKRLSLPSFVENAPAEVVAEARTQVAALLKSKSHLEASISLVDELLPTSPLSKNPAPGLPSTNHPAGSNKAGVSLRKEQVLRRRRAA